MGQGSFDMKRLSMGTKGALIIGGIALVNMFIPWWNSVDLGAFGGGGGVGGFNGIGVLAGILLIGLLVWEGLNAAGSLAAVSAPKKLITAGLAAGAALFMILRGLLKPSAGGFSPFTYGIGTWIGILLGLGLLYAAYVSWQEHQTGMGTTPGAPPPPPAA